MAVENVPVDGLTENDDVRRKALLRLGVAGVVTAAALAGLWWLDQSGGKPGKSVSATPPSPIVSAPLQASAPPQDPAEMTAPQPETPGVTPETTPDKVPGAPAGGEVSSRVAAATSQSSTPATREAPPPPHVSNAPRAVPSAPQASAATPPAERRPALPAATLGVPYLVRLGIFSEPTRARELVDRLKHQGIRAHIETRVNMGPFANREEAEKAQATLRKLGIKGELIPAAATQ